jgi:hypothetical protein
VQGPGEEKQYKEDAIVEREDAQGAAGIEGFEEVGAVARVQKDAGDEKAGENEEEINADVAGSADVVDQIEELRACHRIRLKEVKEEDQEDGETAYAVKRWNMLKTAGIFGVAGRDGLRGGGRRHDWIIGYLWGGVKR